MQTFDNTIGEAVVRQAALLSVQTSTSPPYGGRFDTIYQKCV